jgi:hypothetical protein
MCRVLAIGLRKPLETIEKGGGVELRVEKREWLFESDNRVYSAPAGPLENELHNFAHTPFVHLSSSPLLKTA